jgi:RNA-directed DNA polymerase
MPRLRVFGRGTDGVREESLRAWGSVDAFFDRVHHQRLMSRLAERVHDKRLLVLVGQMLKAKVVLPDGVTVNTDEGVPQGGPLSPLLSNIVLDELDQELARRGHRFVRYADDANIYVRSERAGQRVMASVKSFIERRLRLKVNEAKSAVARPEERHFLGFRLRREPLDGSAEVLLSKRSKERIDSRIRELTPRNWGNSVDACIKQVGVYLLGWIQFFGICTLGAERELALLDAHIRRRLRAIQLKHWKTQEDDRKETDRAPHQAKNGMARCLQGAKILLGAEPHKRRGPGATEFLLGCTWARFAARPSSQDARANRCPDSACAELGYGEVVTRPAAGVITGGPEEPYVNSTSTVL